MKKRKTSTPHLITPNFHPKLNNFNFPSHNRHLKFSFHVKCLQLFILLTRTSPIMSVWKFPAWGICMFSVLNLTTTAFNQVNGQFGGECFCYGTKTKFWSWLGRLLAAAAWSALKNLPVTVFGQRSVFLAKDPAPHLRWARQWSNDSISHPLYF